MSDRRKAKSNSTIDREIPGAFEGETVTRRRLMTGTAHVAGAVAASAFLLPSLGFAVGPIFEEFEQPWQDVAGLDEIPDDTYIPKTYTMVPDIGQAGKSTIYLRRRNEDIDSEPADEYNQVVAISTRSPSELVIALSCEPSYA